MNRFEESLRNQLRQSETQLDETAVRSLQASRQIALSKARFHHRWRILVPVAGMMAASIVTVVLFWSPLNGNHSQAPTNALSIENTDFYEDLEFYNWLAQNDARQRS